MTGGQTFIEAARKEEAQASFEITNLEAFLSGLVKKRDALRDLIACYDVQDEPLAVAPKPAPVVSPNQLQPDLNPMEEAELYASLIASDPEKWTVATIADAKGKTHRYVQQRLALVNKLDPEAKEELRAGKLSVTEAREQTQSGSAEAKQTSDKLTVGGLDNSFSLTASTVWNMCAKIISETGLCPTQYDLAKAANVHPVNVLTAIRQLDERGYLRREGAGKYQIVHIEKWPVGISPRATTGRADGAVPPRLKRDQLRSETKPSTLGGKPARRFDHADFDPASVMCLPSSHAALIEKRTLFPNTVVRPSESPRLLISGINSPKLGDRVTKGDWSGMPMFSLTLEERKTCPTSCSHWGNCYGNGMPLARRHKVDADFWPKMHGELETLQADHPQGFVVRLHVLGDFVDIPYVQAWASALEKYPALHIFGYTAWAPTSNLGFVIESLRDKMWERFAIRFSSADSQPGGATTITRRDRGQVAEGFVCPAQSEQNVCCGSCGWCWSKSTKDKTVVFMMHGRTSANQEQVIQQTVPPVSVLIKGPGHFVDEKTTEIKTDSPAIGLSDALDICRHDGDHIETLAGKSEWRINGREILTRDGVIARGQRIANKRKVLGVGA